ncbi:hypothetical protein FHS86_002358 [Roseimarinus sediminis]
MLTNPVLVVEERQKKLSLQIIFPYIPVENVEKSTVMNVEMEMGLCVRPVVLQVILIMIKFIQSEWSLSILFGLHDHF